MGKNNKIKQNIIKVKGIQKKIKASGEDKLKAKSKEYKKDKGVVDIDNIFNSLIQAHKIKINTPLREETREIDLVESVKGNKDDIFGKESIGGRKKTEEGYNIYTEDELNLKVDSGNTDLCPFDCECCF